MPTIHGVCPHDCPDSCGLLSEIDDAGNLLGVRGDSDHPLTQGWLCAKLRDYRRWVNHPQRLHHPQRRVGKKGEGRFERMDWEEALTIIATRFQKILREEGGAAILPYSYSGTLGLVQMNVASSRLWNRLGACGLQRSICGAAAELAVQKTLGARWAPAVKDLEHSRLIVLWGHNPATTAPHVMPALRRAQREGCEVVVIDPRRTLSTKSASWHLAPKPATDGALALGLMHVLWRDELVDEHWLATHALGAADLQTRVASFPPTRVAAITGLQEESIVRLAHRYGQTKPALIKIADGLQRHTNGGQTVRAISALPALVGQYGVRGGGLFYSTSDVLRWDEEAVGKASECPPTPRVVNMNRLGAALCGEVSGPPIRALYVFGANPATSAPNTAAVTRGLAREDLFTVVHELFITDTARYADIVLPATSQLEQLDLHKAYGHHLLRLNQPALAPRGAARSNWDVMRGLARHLGFEESWLKADARAVIEEVLAATRNHAPALQGIDLTTLEREHQISLVSEGAVPFADGHFPTPSGKVELNCAAMEEHGLDRLPDYDPPQELDASTEDGGLILLSGATHHFVSSSLHSVESLRRKEGPPRLEIHPDDAASRGIEDGQRVRVFNARGHFEVPACVTNAVRPGVVVALKGHWSEGNLDGRQVNWTTPDALGDLAGQSTFHSNGVWVVGCNAGELARKAPSQKR
ncbi:MAG: molybdopterin oxidoreductase family protein [Deltaproteobacteria bacterium]|nr:molybdopterin oxidoreductase family protein [Deltaproteobacteria bacterium]